MPVYGLQTFKSDGTTVVLQNSTKSGVFGTSYSLAKSGTAGLQTVVEFPEYTGRSIRPMQLRPGGHTWYVGVVNNIPRITFTENSAIGVTSASFYYEDTVLYIFVK
jgi:hypothetical protein